MGKNRTDARSGDRLGSFLILLLSLLCAGNSLSAQNRYPIRQETKGKEPLYGFINRKGETVIPPRYSQVQDFDSGYCAVQDPPSKHWGLIDTAGKWILKPQYAAILTPFYCGVGAVGTATKDSTLQYVNLKGEVIFQTPHIWVNLWNPETNRYEGVHPFHEGYAVYGKADSTFPQVRILTMKGKFLTKDSYYEVNFLYDGEDDHCYGCDGKIVEDYLEVITARNPLTKKYLHLEDGKVLTKDSLPNYLYRMLFPSYGEAPASRDYPQCYEIPTSNKRTANYIEGENYPFESYANIIQLSKEFLEVGNYKYLYQGYWSKSGISRLDGELCEISFGKQPAYPIWHRHPLAYYDLMNYRWFWRQREESSHTKDISGTYMFIQQGKPIEILILKCPDRKTLEAEYYSTAFQKKETVQLSIKDYRPQDRAFSIKFQGFNTYYPCFLKDAGTLILNNPENKLQEFVRVK